MILFWLGFLALVGAFLALDLGVFHRKAHAVHVKEALVWSVVWILTSLGFSVFIYFAYAHHWLGLGQPDPSIDVKLRDIHFGLDGFNAWLKYVTGYVVEWSLSVDNIFVIALIFSYFRIPAKYQHRVLFWGILGAIVMRGGFILAGSAIIQKFHYVLYLFGAFLLFTAIKMLTADSDPDPGKSKVLKQLYRRFNVTDVLHGTRFVIFEGEVTQKEKTLAETPTDVPPQGVVGQQDVGTLPYAERHRTGKRILTPLAVALVIVEVTDLVFAVDSIPAIFGITQDPFIVFTSNIFAILGLRSMYFALAGLLEKFYLLKTALALILGMVGVKMLVGEWIEHRVGVSHNTFSVMTLAIVIGLLASGVIASLVFPKKHAPASEVGNV
jgi:tellurite resistance protein TerC